MLVISSDSSSVAEEGRTYATAGVGVRVADVVGATPSHAVDTRAGSPADDDAGVFGHEQLGSRGSHGEAQREESDEKAELHGGLWVEKGTKVGR